MDVQIPEGFLAGERRTTRRRQTFVVMTAISREMVRRGACTRLACRPVIIDKKPLPLCRELQGVPLKRVSDKRVRLMIIFSSNHCKRLRCDNCNY